MLQHLSRHVTLNIWQWLSESYNKPWKGFKNAPALLSADRFTERASWLYKQNINHRVWSRALYLRFKQEPELENDSLFSSVKIMGSLFSWSLQLSSWERRCLRGRCVSPAERKTQRGRERERECETERQREKSPPVVWLIGSRHNYC